MGFKHRSLLLYFRVFGLFITLAITSYVLFLTPYRISEALLCLITFAQLAELTTFIDTENRQLARFISALLHNDFTYHLPEKALRSSKNTWQYFANLLMQKIASLQHEKQEKHLLLQLITDNAGTGFLVFDEKGEVSLINDEAKKLLGAVHIKHVSALNHYAEGMAEKLLALQAGEKMILRLVRNSIYLQVIVKAKRFRQKNNAFTLITLQHIGTELEEQEIASWQKLTSVLSHEIMNSLTPVISLASSANNILQKLEQSQEGSRAEMLADVKGALNIIEKRSNAILSFVQAYRKVNKIPVPELELVSIGSILAEAIEFFNSKGLENIELRNLVPESVNNKQVFADAHLILQVLQNLLINAIQALEDLQNAYIEVKAIPEGDAIVLLILDNGEGIPQENRDKIFVPFYSTKPNGSGVGLSICKQIMHAHGGDIYLLPAKISGDKTVFALRLKLA